MSYNLTTWRSFTSPLNKHFITVAGFEPVNLASNGMHTNNNTTEDDIESLSMTLLAPPPFPET
jgi:hypothetical protein